MPHPAIEQLPAIEVEKICAGEVVERPLNVVKELIENSLDAGATQIAVELTDGGKELIRVADNGAGIPAAELPLALKPHCTSKIRAMDDIYALSTLGFRGEALSSIAAVSRLRITSRRADDELGARIEINGGAMTASTRLSFQPGTEVEVRELFFNTPARLKFLRSKQAETGRVTTLLSAYALAFPEVRWEVSSQGRMLLSTSGDGNLRAVLTGLVGAEAGEHLARVDFEFPPSAVSGYISTPQHHRHNRQRQWYFVNHRPVINKMLYKAVDDAVREFMSSGKFPLGAFFLELPPEEIDVNVHPMKHEVSFAQPQGVYSLLLTAVSRALGNAASARQHRLTRGLATVVHPAVTPQQETPDAKPEPLPPTSIADDPASDPDAPPGQRAIPQYREGQQVAPPRDAQPIPGLATAMNSIEFPGGKAVRDPELATPDVSLEENVINRMSQSIKGSPLQAQSQEIYQGEQGSSVSLVSQVADTYLVAVTEQAVYLIDQHAAHERILFEQLIARMAQGADKVRRQQLLFPLLVQLTPGEAQVVELFSRDLATLGFGCELGAANNLVVREVPLMLGRGVTPELLHAVLTELSHHETSTTLAERQKELAASLACRAAIKAGDSLAPDERYELVRQLLSRESTLSCPHGRPAVIRLGHGELAQMFLR